MSFTISKDKNLVILTYKPFKGAQFLIDKFDLSNTNAVEQSMNNIQNFIDGNFEVFGNEQYKKYEDYHKKGFIFSRFNYISHKTNKEEEVVSCSFIIGNLVGDYYRIPKFVLSNSSNEKPINYDVLLFKEMNLDISKIVHESNVNYFGIINEISPEEPIVIGGDTESSISLEDFEKILRSLPRKSGYEKYTRAKTESLFSEYFNVKKDYIEEYNNYINKRKIDFKNMEFRNLYEIEEMKYKLLLENMRIMLMESEKYSESQWQKKILETILILFPKYLYSIEELSFKTPDNQKRRIDISLIDVEGNIDIIEIKKPENDSLLSKNLSRNNFVPVKSLSSALFQAEKYIFHLNKAGRNAESKYQEKLTEMKIAITAKITNPKGIVIIGRDHNLSPEQKSDFEIMKRQFSNIMDIITYDDLLRRLESLVQKFSKKKKEEKE